MDTNKKLIQITRERIEEDFDLKFNSLSNEGVERFVEFGSMVGRKEFKRGYLTGALATGIPMLIVILISALR